ncbi:anti-sigma factor [Arthrobacter sp. ISL-48]|uniref:anti-sigma factor n=1 Tax=Arthrobacter sp. ISL-48 TaxID=2819110 RepID=UPI001BE68595|nr:anti-sigma factor [Arthrobacter sp. ISL-48]MBT2531894.1 anti-sigma factor [Arthrobacter sp. ISL-48]
MTDMNNHEGSRRPGPFGETVATDLASGRAVDLAELYALDAVTVAERSAIEQYISSVSEAERSSFLERVRQARESLAATFTAEEEPPTDLFARIVSQLPAQSLPPAGAPPAAAQAGAEAPPNAADVSPAAHDSETTHTRDDLSDARQRREQRRRQSGPRRWLAGIAAAAVLALGGVGVGAYIADQNDPLNQVVRADDVREESVDVSGGGRATVLISPSKDAVVVRMNGVPAPPEGKVYQMWLIPKDGSAPVSQGLMDEAALSKPALVKGIASAAALGFTVEPVGGSTSPTLPTVAAAPLGT